MKISLIHSLYTFFAICFLSNTLYAQVGINILQADSSAILHLESTNRGFLPPRMTTNQRDSIFSPKPGLSIYNTDNEVMQYYTGVCWLNVWQKTCDECIFDFSPKSLTGNIDRTISNSNTTTLYFNKKSGNQGIVVYNLPNLPDGMTVNLNKALVSNSIDSIEVTVTADIFTPPGQYPIILQAICGSITQTQVYLVTVDPCIEIDINNPQVDYDLQAANNLPTNQPICVVARIAAGVSLTNTNNAPVFTTGNLHPNSNVGILNNGSLLALGGNGGQGAGTQGQTGTGAGEDGTDALNLTVNTHLQNNGRIYAGGGGGGSVGLIVTIPIGTNNFDLGLGAGGGGGASSGLGGNISTGLPFYEPGTDAGSGPTANKGLGGVLNAPITLSPFAGFSLIVNPNAYGGDGGAYGEDGLSGFLFVNVKVEVPLVGTVFDQDFPNPPVSNFPAGGKAGLAIRSNGNTLIGVTPGIYQNNQIKGAVN